MASLFGETAKLVVDLSLTGNFASQIGKTSRSLDKFSTKLDRTESRAFQAGQQIGTGIKRSVGLVTAGVGILASQVAFGAKTLADLETKQAQTAAVIKSTGGAAHVTAKQVRDMAEAFENVNAIFDDKVIQSGENMLLTFTKVRKEAFKPAIQAALDMSVAMGVGPEGLTKIVLQLGKALQDPVKGITALRRSGVTFDKQQIARIKFLVKHNRLLDAQRLILAELNKEFGGSFKKQGQTTLAVLAKFGDAIEDIQVALARAMFPAIRKIADALTGLASDPQTLAFFKDIGDSVGSLFTKENIQTGVGLLKDAFTVMQGAAPIITQAAGGIATVVKTAVAAFKTLPPELQKLAVGAFVINKLTSGLITNVAGALLGGALKTIFADNVTVIGGNVTGGGGVPGAVPTGAGKGLSTLSKVFLIGEAIGLVAAVNEVRTSIEGQATEQAQSIHKTLTDVLSNPRSTDAQLQTALDGINQGIAELNKDPIGTALVGQGALKELQDMKAILENRLPQSRGGAAVDKSVQQHLHEEHIRRGKSHIEASLEASIHALDKSLGAIAATQVAAQDVHGRGEHSRAEPPGASTQTMNDLHTLAAKLRGDRPIGTGLSAIEDRTKETATAVGTVKTSTDAVKLSTDGVKSQTLASGNAIQNTTRSSSLSNAAIVSSSIAVQTGAIVGAIFAARPVVNVTAITKTTTVNNRYGSGNGSQGTPPSSYGSGPP